MNEEKNSMRMLQKTTKWEPGTLPVPLKLQQ